MEKFDVIVIGGGAAGLTVAIGTAKAGKKVLMIEKHKTGGECTWSGCIPSKALIHLAHKHDTVNTFQKARAISEMIYTHETPEILESYGMTFIKGEASFVDPYTISVNGTNFIGNTIILATGSIPYIPPIKGLDEVDFLTNQEIFNQEKLPTSLVFIGGGVISLELSMALAQLGVKVTILEQNTTILAKEDTIVQETITGLLKDLGITLITDINLVSVKKNGTNTLITYIQDNQETTTESEKIFITAGRQADLEGLQLDKASIKYTKNGISVNDYMQTNHPHIYALGDVVGPFRFSHVAGAQGEVIVRNMILPFFKKKFVILSLPWIIFSTPEFARCGLNEKEAQDQNIDYKVYSTDAHHLERAIISGDNHFFIKVLTHKGNIIGAYCLGERAGEIISFFQFMIELKIPLHKLMKGMFPYPSYMNGIRALGKQAFLDKIFDNPIVKIFRK